MFMTAKQRSIPMGVDALQANGFYDLTSCSEIDSSPSPNSDYFPQMTCWGEEMRLRNGDLAVIPGQSRALEMSQCYFPGECPNQAEPPTFQFEEPNDLFQLDSDHVLPTSPHDSNLWYMPGYISNLDIPRATQGRIYSPVEYETNNFAAPDHVYNTTEGEENYFAAPLSGPPSVEPYNTIESEDNYFDAAMSFPTPVQSYNATASENNNLVAPTSNLSPFQIYHTNVVEDWSVYQQPILSLEEMFRVTTLYDKTYCFSLQMPESGELYKMTEREQNYFAPPLSCPAPTELYKTAEDEQKYVAASLSNPTPVQTRAKPCGKKIDLAARRYIVEEEKVDVKDVKEEMDVKNVKEEMDVKNMEEEIDVEKMEEGEAPILHAPDAMLLLDQFEQAEFSSSHNELISDLGDLPDLGTLLDDDEINFDNYPDIIKGSESEEFCNDGGVNMSVSTNDCGAKSTLASENSASVAKVVNGVSTPPCKPKDVPMRSNPIETINLAIKEETKTNTKVSKALPKKDEKIRNNSKTRHTLNSASRRDIKQRKASKVAQQRLKLFADTTPEAHQETTTHAGVNKKKPETKIREWDINTALGQKLKIKPKKVDVAQRLSSRVSHMTTVNGASAMKTNVINVTKHNIAYRTKPNGTNVMLSNGINVTKPNGVSITKPTSVSVIKQDVQIRNPSLNRDKKENRYSVDPQELIAKLKESTKRKQILVIDPIPNKKRGHAHFSSDTSSPPMKKVKVMSAVDRVSLDHAYSQSPYCENQSKDSGFQSAEEDEKTLITQQPTTLTSDGTLMVSLLKANTIHNSTKKINIEEYRKLRPIKKSASQNNSPGSSTCSSPLPEDENLKQKKYAENLKRMAVNVLKAKKSTNSNEETPKKQQITIVSKNLKIVVPRKAVPPPDLDVRTSVSIATNTEISRICSSKRIMASSKELETIQPLLKEASDKISPHSLINSVIENIPKLKTTTSPSQIPSTIVEGVHEDRVIQYLKKDRIPAKTTTVGTQTDFDDEDDESRCKRGSDSANSSPSYSSSGSVSSNYNRYSRLGHRTRRTSSSSTSSSNSSSQSFCSSRSRTRAGSPYRSRSPRWNRLIDEERLKEMEERKVVFVGGIAKGLKKQDLQKRFQRFGNITNITLHFRDNGENYGFVTFADREDAYEAKLHGNDDQSFPHYDLSFGGRRIFCKTKYSDLDNMREQDFGYCNRSPNNSFDALLREAKENLRNRSS